MQDKVGILFPLWIVIALSYSRPKWDWLRVAVMIFIHDGQVLYDGAFRAVVLCCIRGGKESRLDIDGAKPTFACSLNADGCFVLPGIVDIHGDAFERQIMPRPGVGFDLDLALWPAPCGDPVVMLVDDWVEALGFNGPYSALFFSGFFTLRRRQKDCSAMQKLFYKQRRQSVPLNRL